MTIILNKSERGQGVYTSLDEKGLPLAWQDRIVGQSIGAGTAFEAGLIKEGIDQTSVEGAADTLALPFRR